MWGDSRGLFAFVQFENHTLDVGTFAPDGSALMFNDGTGWVQWAEITNAPGLTAPHRMAGIPDGPVYLQYGSCALRRTGGPGDSTCLVESDAAMPDGPVITPLSETTGYGLSYAGDAFDLSGDTFETKTPLSFTGPVSQLWGDGLVHRAVVRSSGQTHLLDDDSTILFSMGADVTAWWVVDRSDIWLAGGPFPDSRIYHWSATGPAPTPVDIGTGSAVVGMWGSADKVYFIRAHAFGSVDSSGVSETIVDFDDGSSGGVEFTSIWGDVASGDVYLAVTDGRYNRTTCGVTFMLYYDGMSLHQF